MSNERTDGWIVGAVLDFAGPHPEYLVQGKKANASSKLFTGLQQTSVRKYWYRAPRCPGRLKPKESVRYSGRSGTTRYKEMWSPQSFVRDSEVSGVSRSGIAGVIVSYAS